MKYIVSVSGGLGSAEALKRTIETYGKENTIAVFADVKGDGSHDWLGMPTVTRLLHERFGGESRDTYSFIWQLSHHFDIDIERIEHPDKLSIYDIFYKTKSISPMTAVCKASEILKRQAIANWIKAQGFRQHEFCIVLGMGWDEEHRIKTSAVWWRNAMGYAVDIIAPNARRRAVAWQLAHNTRYQIVSRDWHSTQTYSYASNEDTALWLMEAGITIPEAYGEGAGHNNCGKKCVLGGLYDFGMLYELDHEGYLYAAFMEWAIQQAIGKPYTILRNLRQDAGRVALSLYEYAGQDTQEAALLNRPNIHLGNYRKQERGACSCFTDIDILREYVDSAPKPMKQLQLLEVAA